MVKIVVVGSTNTDMVIKSNRIPRPGETILGWGFFSNLGGKGANQAVAAARMGGDVSFITKVGEDDFGKQAVSCLEEEGIATDYVYRDSNIASGVALITLSEEGENSIVVAPGANEALLPKHIDKAVEEIKQADIVLVQLEIPMKTVEYVMAIAKKYRKKTILNPAPARLIDESLYRGLFAITPNETEIQILTGVEVLDNKSAHRSASILRDKGVENVIITIGARGAYIFSDDFGELVPSYPVDVKDTTAAGDTFNGAFALAIGRGMPLKNAITFANSAASISVTRMGAQASIPKLEEVDAIIDY